MEATTQIPDPASVRGDGGDPIQQGPLRKVELRSLVQLGPNRLLCLQLANLQ